MTRVHYSSGAFDEFKVGRVRHLAIMEASACRIKPVGPRHDAPHLAARDRACLLASPADPDRPSLAAVVGTAQTLLLDGGASAAHTEQFLSQLEAAAVSAPDFAVLGQNAQARE